MSLYIERLMLLYSSSETGFLVQKMDFWHKKRGRIDWAAITTLSSAVASMVKADIETADIDWSHIKDLATDTAIITQGTAGELYISKLAVTEANLVSLTVGELVVKGEDVDCSCENRQ